MSRRRPSRRGRDTGRKWYEVRVLFREGIVFVLSADTLGDALALYRTAGEALLGRYCDGSVWADECDLKPGKSCGEMEAERLVRLTFLWRESLTYEDPLCELSLVQFARQPEREERPAASEITAPDLDTSPQEATEGTVSDEEATDGVTIDKAQVAALPSPDESPAPDPAGDHGLLRGIYWIAMTGLAFLCIGVPVLALWFVWSCR